MPLLDHFHPPLSQERHWESFLATWATEIVASLNSVLAPTYFSEASIYIGGRLQVTEGPGPTLVMPAHFPDEIEIQVIGGPTGGHLVAAIELISPGNKDRPEARRAFAAKCASYLQVGIGLVIVDVVTERAGNLHNELVQLMQKEEKYQFPGVASLYAVAYRPARREPGGDQIDIWPMPLALGQNLPIVPLALRGAVTLPLDLEATYSEARQRSRL